MNVHGTSYEPMDNVMKERFRALQTIIAAHQCIKIAYQKADVIKFVELKPYRMINHEGVWYLAAVDGDTPKAYALSRIRSLETLPQNFMVDPEIHKMLDQEDSIWLNLKKTEVVLTVAAPVADYFRRRKLLAQQVVVKDLENGGLIVSGKFAHQNQILPLVRQWIPYVRIVSPENWQEDLENELKKYLE